MNERLLNGGSESSPSLSEWDESMKILVGSFCNDLLHQFEATRPPLFEYAKGTTKHSVERPTHSDVSLWTDTQGTANDQASIDCTVRHDSPHSSTRETPLRTEEPTEKESQNSESLHRHSEKSLSASSAVKNEVPLGPSPLLTTNTEPRTRKSLLRRSSNFFWGRLSRTKRVSQGGDQVAPMTASACHVSGSFPESSLEIAQTPCEFPPRPLQYSADVHPQPDLQPRSFSRLRKRISLPHTALKGINTPVSPSSGQRWSLFFHV